MATNYVGYGAFFSGAYDATSAGFGFLNVFSGFAQNPSAESLASVASAGSAFSA